MLEWYGQTIVEVMKRPAEGAGATFCELVGAKAGNDLNATIGSTGLRLDVIRWMENKSSTISLEWPLKTNCGVGGTQAIETAE
jgi:hypothetical protein